MPKFERETDTQEDNFDSQLVLNAKIMDSIRTINNANPENYRG